MQQINDYINQYPEWHDTIRYGIQMVSIITGLLLAAILIRF